MFIRLSRIPTASAKCLRSVHLRRSRSRCHHQWYRQHEWSEVVHLTQWLPHNKWGTPSKVATASSATPSSVRTLERESSPPAAASRDNPSSETTAVTYSVASVSPSPVRRGTETTAGSLAVNSGAVTTRVPASCTEERGGVSALPPST
jgi:hypothetical protein